MSLDTNTVVLPLEVLDEIIYLAVQPCYGLKTQSAIALTFHRGRMYANKARFSTVHIGRYRMSDLQSDDTVTVTNYLEKRVSFFADLIRAGDEIRTMPGVCGFIRSVVLRVQDLTTTMDPGHDKVFINADFQFILDRLFRILPQNLSFGVACPTRVECSFTLGLRYIWMPSATVFKSLKHFFYSSQLDRLSLYNVLRLPNGLLSQCNIKHLVLYKVVQVSADPSLIEDLDGTPHLDSEEERNLGSCPLESLETDMSMTLDGHFALFSSYSSGVIHRLPGHVVFPCLTKLRLHHKRIHTREFNIMANEILLNAPALEDLFIYNGDYLPKILHSPERSVLPLRYSHLIKLRSFSFESYIPTNLPIEILMCLCADNPPPSLSEIILEATIDLRNGLSEGVRQGENYIRCLSLDKLDAFLCRPGYEQVRKVVVRLRMAMDIYQPDRELVEGGVILLRDTVRKAVAHQLELKSRDLELNIQLEL
uniref:Uncharacterized protein n=1 Tax=Psilocybe cubensis TaxID=181762 RepID=A0A8H7XQZ3_PSICU